MPPKKRKAASKVTGNADIDSTSDSSTVNKIDYKNKTVAELRNICSQRGLSTAGTKTALIDRLLENDEGVQEDVPTKLQKQDSVNTKIKKAFDNLKSQTKAKTNFKVDTYYCGNGTVVEDYACMLNQTNINQNNNKFYVIQLLKVLNSYAVFTRWGRVGEGGQQSTTNIPSLEQAVRDFEKKFKDKTKNDWKNRDQFVPHPGKYTLLEMDDDGDDEEEEDSVDGGSKQNNAPLSKQLVDGKAYAKCTLDDVTMRLIQLIFDDNTFKDSMQAMDLDVKKMPLGKLSKAQIGKGFEALVAIEDAIKTSSSKTTIDALSSKFYTLIPHSFGRQVPPAINTPELVQRKKDMLLVLSDIELTMSLQKEEKQVQGKGEKLEPHPLDVKYQLLKCKLTLLSRTSKEYKIIQTYIDHTGYQGNQKKKNPNVWQVDRESESERFKTHANIKERKLLWHGTNVAVVAAILSSGLRIMPHSGGRVGKGIYFASEQSKSLGYVCYASDGTGIMFLNEVALGKEHTITKDDHTLEAAPTGYQCVVARGRKEPDPKADTTITLDGKTVVVPQGKPINTKFTDSYFDQSEYLVYKESQARIRYLISF